MIQDVVMAVSADDFFSFKPSYPLSAFVPKGHLSIAVDNVHTFV
jgi:hypothetical protein